MHVIFLLFHPLTLILMPGALHHPVPLEFDARKGNWPPSQIRRQEGEPTLLHFRSHSTPEGGIDPPPERRDWPTFTSVPLEFDARREIVSLPPSKNSTPSEGEIDHLRAPQIRCQEEGHLSSIFVHLKFDARKGIDTLPHCRSPRFRRQDDGQPLLLLFVSILRNETSFTLRSTPGGGKGPLPPLFPSIS